MPSRKEESLSSAEKRARLAGGLGRGDANESPAGRSPASRAGANSQVVGGSNEDPAARRKRLIWGVGLSLVAVAAMVVLILVLAAS